MQRHSILCRVFLEPHCAKEDASLIWSLRAGAGERTWFLCRAPSSSSDAVFMVPHRSFTILWRICAFGPPVPGCAKQSRVSSCYSSYSIQKENWVFRVKRSLRLQPRKLRTEIPPVAPAWSRVIPRNRVKYLQAPVRVTWSTIASDRDSEEKKKANVTSCHRRNKPAQSLYSTKEITKSFFFWLRLHFCPSAPVFRTLPGATSAPVPQIRWGWDGMGWDASTRLSRFPNSDIEPGGDNRQRLLCSRRVDLAGASDKTGTSRLVCSACEPHGAHRASDCR